MEVDSSRSRGGSHRRIVGRRAAQRKVPGRSRASLSSAVVDAHNLRRSGPRAGAGLRSLFGILGVGALACAGGPGMTGGVSASADSSGSSAASTASASATASGSTSAATASAGTTGTTGATGTTGTTGSSSGTSTSTASGPTSTGETGGETTGEEPGLRVLFVGNSYTAGNNLITLVSAMADADPEATPLLTEAIVVGGETMAGHLGTPSTTAAISEGAWDFVVLQGQSVEPLVVDGDFSASAIELATLVVDAGATPLLFETWARKEGHELYLEDWYGMTPEEAQAGLRAAYQGAADASGGTMAPAGDAWEVVWTSRPDLELYAGDGSHASLAGTYLAACVFFEVLTGRSPVGNGGLPGGLDPAEAMILQVAAESVFP